MNPVAVQCADVNKADPRARHRVGTGRSLPLWAVLLGIALAVAWLTGRLADIAEPSAEAGMWWAGLGAPPVALLVILAVRRGWHDRASWPVLLGVGYLASGVWTVAFALLDPPLLGPPVAADGTLHLPDLVLTGLQELGAEPGLISAALGLALAAVTPLVAVATRSLCDEPTARHLLPVLVLAPYALLAGDTDSLAAVLAAAMLTVAVLASERGRPVGSRVALAGLCGLLLGLSALFGYSAIWLAAGTLCVFFVRRRPLLNVATGLASLVPLLVAEAAGADWTGGLVSELRGPGGDRSVLSGAAVVVLALLVIGGPALIASIGRVRTTPGWPFLVGGGAVLLVPLAAGLLAGQNDPGAWLPGLPWLLVAAVAPPRQGGRAVPTPVGLVTVGAVTAYAVAVISAGAA
ncbi:hypothetical protein BH20ACT5_BH20ACT5_07460 [soil metagenome]